MNHGTLLHMTASEYVILIIIIIIIIIITIIINNKIGFV